MKSISTLIKNPLFQIFSPIVQIELILEIQIAVVQPYW